VTSALIGYTGFVGGNLARQMHFDEFYNSKNIEDIRQREFDLVVCAGAPGAKWYANEHRDEDFDVIVRLLRSVREVRAKTFVLISTIDVLNPRDAYGNHRADLEAILRSYRDTTTVRLPALFGRALRKNALYDLMTSNRLYDIAPNATYQWHPLRWLGSDLTHIIASGERTINIASEPVTMEDVRARFFPRHRIGLPSDAAPHYAIAGHPDYSLTRGEVLDEMGAFLAGHA
jgi:nucleoside-diphosphate-sugar epimerase